MQIRQDPGESTGAYVIQAALIETIFSFLFVLLYFINSEPKTRYSKDIVTNCLFTSIAYGACVICAYSISGGSLNPAIGGAFCIGAFIDKPKEFSRIAFVWIYVAMPLIGAALAVLFFDYGFANLVIDKENEDGNENHEEEFEETKYSAPKGNS